MSYSVQRSKEEPTLFAIFDNRTGEELTDPFPFSDGAINYAAFAETKKTPTKKKAAPRKKAAAKKKAAPRKKAAPLKKIVAKKSGDIPF